MKYSQSKELVDELMNIAVLFHASSMLRTKIADVIDKTSISPLRRRSDLTKEEALTLDACMERGCTRLPRRFSGSYKGIQHHVH
jgi:hypothetical protein